MCWHDIAVAMSADSSKHRVCGKPHLLFSMAAIEAIVPICHVVTVE